MYMIYHCGVVRLTNRVPAMHHGAQRYLLFRINCKMLRIPTAGPGRERLFLEVLLLLRFHNMKSDHHGMVLSGLLDNIERHAHTEMTNSCMKRNPTATTKRFSNDPELEPVK
jgi:hypothetical protein